MSESELLLDASELKMLKPEDPKSLVLFSDESGVNKVNSDEASELNKSEPGVDEPNPNKLKFEDEPKPDEPIQLNCTINHMVLLLSLYYVPLLRSNLSLSPYSGPKSLQASLCLRLEDLRPAKTAPRVSRLDQTIGRGIQDYRKQQQHQSPADSIPSTKYQGPSHTTRSSNWETILLALYTSSILILIRSIFRLIEYVQGNDGYIISHEAFMYVFDSALMVCVMVVMNVLHAGVVLGGARRK